MAVVAAIPHLKDESMYADDPRDLNTEHDDDGDESADSGAEDAPTVTTNNILSSKEAEQQELLNHQLRNSLLTRKHDDASTKQDGYDQQGQRIVDKAREYQQELYERAKDENIIAVLDTGMGKTLIAVMLIRDVLEKGLADAADAAPQKNVFFLANRLVEPT